MSQQLNSNVVARRTDFFLLLLIGFSIISSSYYSLNTIGLYVCMPILIISVWFKGWSVILSNKYVKFYLVLVLWMIFTSLTGVDSGKSFSQMPALLASFLVSTCMYYLALNKNNTKFLYFIYIAYYISLFLYLYFYGEIYISDSTESERAGGVAMNANNFAYYLPFLTFGIHYSFSNRDKNLLIEGLVYLLLLGLSLYIALITASRQILVIQIPFISMLVLIRFGGKGLRSVLPFLVFILILIVVLLPWFGNIFSNSLLAHRSETALAEDHRTWLLRRAIEIGADNILFGVGYGNFAKYASGSFSHCSYTELFACTGLLGFLLYSIMVISFVVEQIRRYKRTHKQLFMSFAAFGIIYIASNFFYVYYDIIWLIGFFFIMVGHSQIYYQTVINGNQQLQYPLSGVK